MTRNMLDDAADAMVTLVTADHDTREATATALAETYYRKAVQEYNMGHDDVSERYLTFRAAILRVA